MPDKNGNKHDGYGAGFYCPDDTCTSDTAWVDFVRKEDMLIAFLLTCVVCSTLWTEDA